MIGEDVTTFLNGQFTSDVELLCERKAQLSARVSRTGQLKAYCYIFYLAKNSYLLFCPKFIEEKLKDDLEKFIIMEDVAIEENTEGISLCFDRVGSDEGEVSFFFLNKAATLFLKKSENIFPSDEIIKMAMEYGIPSDELVLEEKTLVNETALVDLAISLNKGCFVGQETVKKIESNRGAGKKEILLILPKSLTEIEGSALSLGGIEYPILGMLKKETGLSLKIKASREHRISGKKYTANIDNQEVEVTAKPFTLVHEAEFAANLFEKGIELFTKNKDAEAKEIFEMALGFVPGDVDIIESLGALEGRLGNYKRAIELMDELERLNPNSVMASTNKSLFYMKLGDIEKAEEEKARATVKGFEVAAQDSKEKAESNIKDIERKISMFEQVLEIDPDDHMANEGLSRSYFNLGKYEESLKYCDKLISLNDKDFRALAIKVKIKMKNGESDYALGRLPEIIELAGKKGDFVLANEMQSLLSSLTNS